MLSGTLACREITRQTKIMGKTLLTNYSEISVTVHCQPEYVNCLAESEEVCLVDTLCMHSYVTNDVNVNVLCVPHSI